MAPCPRLAEKLKALGLSVDDTPGSASSSSCSSSGASRSRGGSKPKTKLTFRIFFPLPPFEGIHFTALKAGQGAYNFTGQLLGVRGQQLQRIKQVSSARLEVVNANGNLNGAHPDPLDETLHARIEADSLAKLQKAADMVCQVLSPSNASFEPLRVEPGGSARLTVVQPVAAQPHSGGPKSRPAGHSKAKPCSTSSSFSSSSGKGVMPPSPALTPVTPASSSSRHGSMFAPSVSATNSCCSSRAPTPSPSMGSHGASRHAAAEHSPVQDAQHDSSSSTTSREAARSKDTVNQLDGFALPPAALPPTDPQTPLAAEEWPLLPSGGANTALTSRSNAGVKASSVGSSSSTTISSSSSTKDANKPSGAHTAISTAGATQSQVSNGGGSGISADGGSSTPVTNGSSAAPAGWAAPTLAVEKPPPASISTASSATWETYGGLSPLTPQAQQYQQQQQQHSQDTCDQQQHQQQQQLDAVTAQMMMSGASVGGRAAATAASHLSEQSAPSSLLATPVKFGLSWDDASFASNGSGAGHSSGMQGAAGAHLLDVQTPLAYSTPQAQFQPHHHQQHQQQAGDLDLMLLRQRAGLVTQACLHYDAPNTSSGCGCGAGGGVSVAECLAMPAAATATLSTPYSTPGAGEIAGAAAGGVSLMSPSIKVSSESCAGLSAAQAYCQHQQQQQHEADALLMLQEQQRQQRREQHMAAVAAAAAAAYNCHDAANDGVPTSLGGISSSSSLPSSGGYMHGLGHMMMTLSQHPQHQQQQQQQFQPGSSLPSGISASPWSPATVAAVSSAFATGAGGGAGVSGGFLAAHSIW